MKTIITAFIILYSGLTHSTEGDLWLDVNVASYHTSSEYCYNGRCQEYNQFNYGAGISYEVHKSLELTGGYFRNSYNKNSFYGGGKIKHDFLIKKFVVTPGVMLGVMTGYEDTEVDASKIQPIALPTLGLAYGKFRGVVGYLPISLIGAGSANVITFQAGIKF